MDIDRYIVFDGSNGFAVASFIEGFVGSPDPLEFDFGIGDVIVMYTDGSNGVITGEAFDIYLAQHSTGG